MLSSFQLEANRRNARLSTGPRTPAGKAAVARNAAKHNLTSVNIAIPGEDLDDFRNLVHESILDLDPRTRTQHAVVEQIAFCEWKLLRIARWESEIVNAALSSRGEAPAQKLFGKSPDEALARLHRYEAQIRRAWHAALREFRALRRTTPEPPPPSVAEALANILEDNHLTLTPASDKTKPTAPGSPRVTNAEADAILNKEV